MATGRLTSIFLMLEDEFMREHAVPGCLGKVVRRRRSTTTRRR